MNDLATLLLFTGCIFLWACLLAAIAEYLDRKDES